MIHAPGRDIGGAPIDQDTKRITRQAASMGAVGIEIVLAILVGFYGGEYLDRKLGTTPWLTRLLLLAGVGAAIKALVRVTRDYQRFLKADDARLADETRQEERHDPEEHAPPDGNQPPHQD